MTTFFYETWLVSRPEELLIFLYIVIQDLDFYTFVEKNYRVYTKKLTTLSFCWQKFIYQLRNETHSRHKLFLTFLASAMGRFRVFTKKIGFIPWFWLSARRIQKSVSETFIKLITFFREIEALQKKYFWQNCNETMTGGETFCIFWLSIALKWQFSK